MALVEYAESELKRAGWFEENSDYGGLLGPAVLEMITKFAAEGHSGGSAHLSLLLFERLARFHPLTPIENPMLDHSFIECYEGVYQSTRLSSLFSRDGGKHWHDIDKRIPKWKRLLGIRKSRVSFPYMPK